MTGAIDYDGVIVDANNEWVPGAVQGLRFLSRKHHLIIHSCRGNYPAGREMVYAKLATVRLAIELWDKPGKPDADWYLDNKGLRFVTWPQALRDLRNL